MAKSNLTHNFYNKFIFDINEAKVVTGSDLFTYTDTIVKINGKEKTTGVNKNYVKEKNIVEITINFGEDFSPFVEHNIRCETKINFAGNTYTISGNTNFQMLNIKNTEISYNLHDNNINLIYRIDVKPEDPEEFIQFKNDFIDNYEASILFGKNSIHEFNAEGSDPEFLQSCFIMHFSTVIPISTFESCFKYETSVTFKVGISGFYLPTKYEDIVIDISSLNLIPEPPEFNITNELTNYSSWLTSPNNSVPFISTYDAVPLSTQQMKINIIKNPIAKYGAEVKFFRIYVDNEWIGTLPKEEYNSYTFPVPTVSTSTETTIGIAVLDTRNKVSEKFSVPIYIFSYAFPLATCHFYRKNNFEQETICKGSATFKSLNSLNNVEITCQAIAKEKGNYGSIKTLTLTDIKNTSSTDFINGLMKGKILDDTFIFDSDKSYNVLIKIKDRVGVETSYVEFVPQGVPLFIQTETGIQAIGMIPKWDSKCKLQVSSDILIDSNLEVGKEIKKLQKVINITTDGTEPYDQLENNIWIKATKITNTIT